MAEPRRRRNGAAVRFVVFVLFTLGVTEAALRIGQPLLPPLRLVDYKTGPWLVANDPRWEVWHVPNATTVHYKSCFAAHYSSNAFGMRDGPRTLHAARPRVAVLGDSFAEGFGVNDDETVASVLEHRELGGRAEVLNFGVSGNFGTTQEWLLYRGLARRFRPDVVVLFFLAANDLTDNSWWYWQRLEPHRRRPYLVTNPLGQVTLFHPGPSLPRPVTLGWSATEALKNRVTSASLLVRVGRELRARLVERQLAAGEHDMDPMALYATRLDAAWRTSWSVTAKSLRRLDRAVTRDGGKLLVVKIPDPAEVDPAAAASIDGRPGFDTSMPDRRLAAITARLGIDYLPLHDRFVAYRDAHRLPPPYFGRDCDSHWSPLGHRLAAEVVADHLRERGF